MKNYLKIQRKKQKSVYKREFIQPAHDVRTTLLRHRFNVLTSFTTYIQRKNNVVCRLDGQYFQEHNGIKMTVKTKNNQF